MILTTQSPVLLNQFRDEPELIHVLGHGIPELPNPAPLSEIHSEGWLAISRPGSLYDRLEFASPIQLSDPASSAVGSGGQE